MFSKGRLPTFFAVLLGVTAFSAPLQAFQLKQDDGGPGGSGAKSAPPPAEEISSPPAGEFQQADNEVIQPVAVAPPVLLEPGALRRRASAPPGASPGASPGAAMEAAAPEVAYSNPSPPYFGGSSVTGVRLGLHPGKTRVVLDLNGRADFSYGVSETGNTVIISFSGVQWRADSGPRRRQGLVSGYSFAREDGGNGSLGIETTAPVRIKDVFAMPPQGGKGHRIVLDLAGTNPVRANPN